MKFLQKRRGSLYYAVQQDLIRVCEGQNEKTLSSHSNTEKTMVYLLREVSRLFKRKNIEQYY